MNPINHPSNNLLLHAPKGTDVQSLNVTASEVEGVRKLVSFWKPTPEELAQLVCGCPVVLGVLGATMPPVRLDVHGETERSDLTDNFVMGYLMGQLADLVTTPEHVHRVACYLVAIAQSAGVVLTVEQQPLLPLAMRNYESVVSTRLAR